METPDRIKTSLRIHTLNHRSGCIGCAYRGDNPAKIPNGCADKLFKDVREYIKQLEARVPRWISVEERMPEVDCNVLVYATGEYDSVVAITSLTNKLHGFNITGWRDPWMCFFHDYAITHWMPLPNSPKEEEKC